MSWAADDRQYVSLCDGSGFKREFKAYYNSRLLSVQGSPTDATFRDLSTYPMLGSPVTPRYHPRYYNFGTLALDGHIYQYLSTFNRSFAANGQEFDADDVLRFVGAKLIYSPNNGQSWCNQDGSTPIVWEDWGDRSRETLIFFEEDQEAFSLLTILQMGRNYEHNQDGRVYVYAPNGNTEGTMNELVLFRVWKERLLDRSAYEYFAGVQLSGEAKWSPGIDARRPVHTFPRGWVNKLPHPYAWQPSVIYNASLGLYMMTSWGAGTGSGIEPFSGQYIDGLWFTKPSYLGFWISQNPWGPWTQIHEETAWMPAGDPLARAYQPQIAPKWIAKDGKSFWLVWTDFQMTDPEAFRRATQRLEKKDRADWTHADWEQNDRNVREFMPYYGFNVQRCDLIMS
jgi:hypothetical protein